MRARRAQGLVLIAALTCATLSQAHSPAHDAVQSQFKSPAEKTARDAIWTSPSMFKVGVVADGTSRDPYAAYVCTQVEAHGLAGRRIRVQIVDIAQLVRTGKWIAIGEARCK